MPPTIARLLPALAVFAFVSPGLAQTATGPVRKSQSPDEAPAANSPQRKPQGEATEAVTSSAVRKAERRKAVQEADGNRVTGRGEGAGTGKKVAAPSRPPSTDRSGESDAARARRSAQDKGPAPRPPSTDRSGESDAARARRAAQDKAMGTGAARPPRPDDAGERNFVRERAQAERKEWLRRMETGSETRSGIAAGGLRPAKER